jgi:4-hydroxythreonine-4-phosphate dehydrogenase
VSVLEVAVIADDLTGAADCGIAFAAAGLETFVSIGGAPPRTAQAVAFDIDSRRRGEAEAAELARAAARRAQGANAGAIYRKLDSTLRGHVGAELAATLRAVDGAEGGAGAGRERPPALVVFAPAFPGTGRTTRGGRVLVKGVPLEETEVWRDSGVRGPAEPAAMLRGAGVRAEVVGLPAVRGGAAGLADDLGRLAAAGVRAAVCDAEREEDLRTIAEAGALVARPVIWAGSAGLARHLPAALRLAGTPGRAARRLVRAQGQADGVIVLVGSRSSVAREQARTLAAEAGVARVELPPADLLAGRGDAAPIARALDRGEDVLAVFGESTGESAVPFERGPELAAAAARLVVPLAPRLSGLVATGGDVARAILGALGAGGVALEGEIEPGVPLGVADSTPPLAVVTKAGAFGSPQTLVRCRAALRARGPRGGLEG